MERLVELVNKRVALNSMKDNIEKSIKMQFEILKLHEEDMETLNREIDQINREIEEIKSEEK